MHGVYVTEGGELRLTGGSVKRCGVSGVVAHAGGKVVVGGGMVSEDNAESNFHSFGGDIHGVDEEKVERFGQEDD